MSVTFSERFKVQAGESRVWRLFPTRELECWLPPLLPPEVTFSLGPVQPGAVLSKMDGVTFLGLTSPVDSENLFRIFLCLEQWLSNTLKRIMMILSDGFAMHKSHWTAFLLFNAWKWQNGPWMRQNWISNTYVWTEAEVVANDHVIHVPLNWWRYSYFRSEWVNAASKCWICEEGVEF